jgi:hypothetical protein
MSGYAKAIPVRSLLSRYYLYIVSGRCFDKELMSSLCNQSPL